MKQIRKKSRPILACIVMAVVCINEEIITHKLFCDIGIVFCENHLIIFRPGIYSFNLNALKDKVGERTRGIYFENFFWADRCRS